MPVVLLHVLVLASVLVPFGGSAHRKTEKGNQTYLEGAYDDALRLYTEAQVAEPQAAELYYDIGNVLFRQEDFEGAAEAYTRALLSAPDELVGPASFNLGNSRYRMDEFGEAVKAYERALQSDSGDVDAKRNLELALRAQEQQQQQQKEQQDDPEDGDEQEGKQNQEQGPQDEQEETEQRNQGEQGEDEPPEEGQGGEQPEPSPEQENGEQEQEGQPGRMTPEQAERMLDGVEEEELENLRKQALQKAKRPARSQEEDW